MTTTEMLMLEKMQTRKLKQIQGLPLRTHDALVRSMVKQPSIRAIIDSKKMRFLCSLIHSNGITKSVFVNRLYDNIMSISNTGFVPEVYTILNRYDLTQFLLTYVCGGEFPTKHCWKSIVKEAVFKYESQTCYQALSEKADVATYLSVMKENLYKKAFPYYAVTMKDHTYRHLLKLAKMISLPTMDETTCSLCSNIYDNVTLHIIMYCTALNKCRDQLWDDIVNVLGVVPTVDLWSKCEEDILIIIMGGYWSPLRDPITRQEFLSILNKYVDVFYGAVKSNIKWFR